MKVKRFHNRAVFRSILSILSLMLVVSCAPATTSQAPEVTSPVSEPATPQPETIRLKTAIIDGPSGITDNNTVTFTWGSLLSSVDPSELTYSTYLQGRDADYLPFSSGTSRTISALAADNYTFYVKAKNAQGQVEPEPASRSFTVIHRTQQQATPVHVIIGGGILLPGSNINRLAIGNDGTTIYALDSAAARLYRSDSAGIGWTDISKNIGGSAPWLALAVAPDDALLVAVATNAGKEVYISADKGANFNSTGLENIIGDQIITSMDISPGYGSPAHEIAVGTGTATAGGSIFINILTGFPSGWINAGGIAPGWLSSGITGVDVFAVKYSPSFTSDGTLLAIVTSATQTFLYSGIRDLGAHTITWNSTTGYPVELCLPGSGTPGTPLNAADIALPADFDSSSPSSRHIFAFWSKNHPSQDIYHIVAYQVYRMMAPEAMASIAFSGTSGRGKMLAGAARCKTPGSCYTIQAYFTANPVSLYPVWQPSQKPPTGTRNARVAWSPDGKIAYAGTAGTESAISHSINNGYTWNQ